MRRFWSCAERDEATRNAAEFSANILWKQKYRSLVPVYLQHLTIIAADIPAAAIGVEDQVFIPRTTLKHAHLQRVDDQAAAHVRPNRRARHVAAEQARCD